MCRPLLTPLSLFSFSFSALERMIFNFSKNCLTSLRVQIYSAHLFRLFRPSFLFLFLTHTSHVRVLPPSLSFHPLFAPFFSSSFYFRSIVIQPFSLSLSLPLILPLYRSLSVRASTHPRIRNESTLCLPSFIGTLIIALVIA